ncbi:MAG: Gfo/Idh/MocA family oxidoreductase [Verrucomicrobia bacterium]|jgi:predicted dehydrogenase/threonine dehydrogenase-like Zn-dependent dehydrogenase|nr:Gfo/Idh/MocA family oxidoreductase [Verrucomicrobiota bacterium]
MKHLLQYLNSGETILAEVPCPGVRPGHVLIETRRSLISLGTEKMLVSFGKSGLISKARQQPEKVKQVLEKVGTDGLLPTIDAVRSKLNQPISLGYCNVGVVLEVGAGVTDLKVGDRVASNGCHGEVVQVPRNLCVTIPDAVQDEAAAFTVPGSIGLQGVRLARPGLGEAFVVTGVGLIGLLTVQLLQAHGCRVLAIDFDANKLELAAKLGAETCNPAAGEDPLAVALQFSRGQGVDGVLITASTRSSDPVSQAAQMCRKRGRIILVGVTGLELNRADFYEKELSFQVSCSYGPGRYDPEYEDKGHDYPIGFVRWTEGRNFSAVLDMIEQGSLRTDCLITHRYAFAEAPKVYDSLSSDPKALGIVLEYEAAKNDAPKFDRRVSLKKRTAFEASKPVLGFIGAGNYASRVLIPAFRRAGAQIHTIVTSGGVSAYLSGQANGFSAASTDVDAIFKSKEINTVVVATRHNTHSRFVLEALQAGKNVFVEKPLALTLDALNEIRDTWDALPDDQPKPAVMVGFNRRFSPHIQKIKALLDPIHEPKVFIFTMNAGHIPADHWTQDPDIGGGRIIGEACHYVDLMRFLADSKVTSIQVQRMGKVPGVEVSEDKASIMLGFENGSFGTIHYLANGSKQFPKERIEVFAAGRTLQLDNFRKLRAYGWPGFRKMNLWRMDKGQNACAKAFLDAIASGNSSPIPFDQIIEVAGKTIEAANMASGSRSAF